MSKCLPCSGVKSNQKAFIKKLKKKYEDGIAEHYLFRTEKGGKLSSVEKKHFNYIFELKIKPNFENGAEYFHISEFKI